MFSHASYSSFREFLRQRSKSRRKNRRNKPVRRGRTARFEPLESRIVLNGSPFEWLPQGPSPIRQGQTEGLPNNTVAGAVQAVAAPRHCDASAFEDCSNLLYIGSANGGVWRTTNANSDSPLWEPLTDDVPLSPARQADSGLELAGLPISALALDSADVSGRTLVAGLGFNSAAVRQRLDTLRFDHTEFTLSGLLRTDDGGQTWQHLDGGTGADSLFGKDIAGLAVHGDSLVVGLRGTFGDGSAGVLTSDDGGVSFVATVAPEGGPFGSILDVAADPSDPQRVYVAERPRDGDAGGVFRGEQQVDGSWQWENLDFPESSADVRTVRLAVNQHGVLYAGVLERVAGARLFRATDPRDSSANQWLPIASPATEEPRPTDSVEVGLHTDLADPLFIDSIESLSTFSLAADPETAYESLQGSFYVGGDRQPGDIGTPPFDQFSTGGQNSLGARHHTARLFRGEAVVTDPATPAISPTYAPLTHADAPSNRPRVHEVEGAVLDRPIRITTSDHGLRDGDQVYVYGLQADEVAAPFPGRLFRVTRIDADQFALDGSDGAGRTYAGGGQWYRFDGGAAPHAGSRDMTFDAAGGLIEINDGGVYRRTNPAQPHGTWSSLNGNLQISELHAVQWDSNFNLLYGSAFDVGVAHQLREGGRLWQSLRGDPADPAPPPRSTHGGALAVDDSSAGRTQVYYSGEKLFGLTRRTITDPGHPERDVIDPVGLMVRGTIPLHEFDEPSNLRPPFALSAGDSSQLVLGTRFLYESRDRGETLWLVNGITGSDRDPSPLFDVGQFQALAYGTAAEPDVLYAGTSQGDIYVRPPGVADPNWLRSSELHRDDATPLEIVIDPSDWQRAYVLWSNGVVSETLDGGDTWSHLPQIANFDVASIALASGPDYDTLFLGGMGTRNLLAVNSLGSSTDGGLLASPEVTILSANLPHAPVSSLDYDAGSATAGVDDEVLAVGTLGRGAWSVDNADELFTFAARTGDVSPINIRSFTDAANYRLESARLLGGGDLAVVSNSDGQFELRSTSAGSELIGTLWPSEVAEPGEPPFSETGRLYFVASLDNSLAEDSDAAAAGFQGKIELHFSHAAGGGRLPFRVLLNVQPGHGAARSDVTLEATPLNLARLRHRLDFLGFLSAASVSSAAPTVTPTSLDEDLADGLRLFQAVVSDTDSVTPAAASGELSYHTVRWLNREDAPRWQASDELPGDVTERSAADWLLGVLHAARDDAGLPAHGVAVVGLPSSSDARAGMAVNFHVPAAARGTDSDPLNATELQLVSVAESLRRFAEARALGQGSLLLTDVLINNGDVADEINTRLSDYIEGTLNPAGFGNVAKAPERAGVTLSDPLMQVRFTAPRVDDSVAGDERDTMLAVIAALRNVGRGLEEVAGQAAPLIAGAPLPFLEERTGEVVQLTETFQQIADRLQSTVTFTGSTAVTENLSQAIPVMIFPDGHDPVEVPIAPIDSGSVSAERLARQINDLEELEGLVEAGFTDDNRLTLSNTDETRADAVTMTTLRLPATSAAPEFGQLPREPDPLSARFSLSFTLETLDGESTEPGRHSFDPVELQLSAVPPEEGTPGIQWPHTQDNIDTESLAEDLNTALRLAKVADPRDPAREVSLARYLHAVVDGDRLAIVARDADVVRIELRDIEHLGRLGFVPTTVDAGASAGDPAEAPTAREAKQKLGIVGTRKIAPPRFLTVPQLMTALGDELIAMGLVPPEFESLQWEHDLATDSLLFDLPITQAFGSDVPLDLTQGIDLGPLGTLEVTAEAQAALEATVGLNLSLGISLGPLGDDFELTRDTPLKELHGGRGVDLFVGIKANNRLPDTSGVLTEDVSLQLDINQGVTDAGGRTLDLVVPESAAADNLDAHDLADDLNAALSDAGVADQLRFFLRGGHLHLLATGPSVRALDIVPDAAARAALGFRNQSDNFDDLQIRETAPGGGERTHDINLLAAPHIGAVAAAIEDQTRGRVTAEITDDGDALRLLGPDGTTLEVAAPEVGGFRSLTPAGLGILGQGKATRRGEPVPSNIVHGNPLHGRSLADRIFLRPPGPEEQTMQLTLEASASDINLGAALGLIGLEVVTDRARPFHASVGLPLALRDPGAGENLDGRISMNELLESDPAQLIDLVQARRSFSGAELSGAFALHLGADLLNESELSGDLAMVNVGLADPQDLNSVTVSTEDTAGFNDVLSQLRELSLDQLLSIARTFVDQLGETPAGTVLETELPLVDRSLGEVIGFFDEVLQAIDRVVSEVDVEQVQEARNRLQSAIVNLPLERHEKSDLVAALQSLDSVLAGFDAARGGFPGAIADAARLPSRLVAAARQLDSLVQQTLALPIGSSGEGEPASLHPTQEELRDAMQNLQAFVPTLNSLPDRLNDQLAPFGLQFDFVADADETEGRQPAILLGLSVEDDNLVSEDFTPKLPAADFGPIDLQLEGDLQLKIGGRIALGFGLLLNDTAAEPLVIVDDPMMSSVRAVKTELDLNVGFDSQLGGDVRFGSFSLVEASADLNLLAARKETHTPDSDGRIELAAAPRGEGGPEKRFMIVSAAGDPLPLDSFEVTGREVLLRGVTADQVTVEYQSADVPGSGTDRADDPANRAALHVQFDPAFTPENTVGAAPLSALLGGEGPDLELTTEGLVTGSVGASLLGHTINDAVTLAVSLEHLEQPHLQVDERALASLLESADFDLKTIFDGIDAFLAQLETWVEDDIADQLPVIGGSLDTELIRDLRQDFMQPLKEYLCQQDGGLDEVRDALEQYIFYVLHDGTPSGFTPSELAVPGLRILGDLDGDEAITRSDVNVVLERERFEVQALLRGGETLADLNFESGLGGLPLEAEGGVQVDLNYEILLGFGIHATEGFYYAGNDGSVLGEDTDGDGSPDPIPEFSLSLTAGLMPDTSLELDLFVLTLAAEENGTTGFQGDLTLDIETDEDGRFRLQDLGDKQLADVFTVALETDVTIDLLLSGGIVPELPNVTTNLVAGMGFELTTEGGELHTQLTDPELALLDISLDLGDFLSKFIGPAINEVQDILEPVEPVVNLLTAEIPGISDISELAGAGPVTVLDLAALQNPEAAGTARKFVNVVDAISEVLAALDTARGVAINFGSLVIAGDELGEPGWNEEISFGGIGTASSTEITVMEPSDGINRQLQDSGSGSLISQMQREPDGSSVGSIDAGLGITLHFLEPQNIFKLLLSQPADIVSWDIPAFELGFGWSQRFPIVPVPPISAEVGLEMGFGIDLSVGYDTRGLLRDNFLDGFFFGDREDVFVGEDIDEFTFGLGVSLAALLDVGVASAGIEGAVIGELGANWRDQDNDGKLYIDQIADIVAQDGVDCLFDLSAEVRAVVSLVWQVLFASGSVDIVDVTLMEVDNSGACPKVRPAHVSNGETKTSDGLTNELPEYIEPVFISPEFPPGIAWPGTLVIHSGNYAPLRQRGASDTAEQFTVRELARGVFEVEGMGMKATYSGVQRILFDGGQRGDSLKVVGRGFEDDAPDNPGVSVPVFGFGGQGLDVLHGGTQADHLDGGDGNDELVGRNGDDTLLGAGGNDHLTGGEGNDLMEGGFGQDTLLGNAGADTLSGGPGPDELSSHGGPDRLFGNAGDDTLNAGEGDDVLQGGSGMDELFGESGRDELRGDSGHDLLDAGTGDDPLVYGGLGNDLLIGDDGVDQLFGGWGDDVILGHRVAIGEVTASDGSYIEGGPDNDFICGDNGVDEIYGGTAEAGFALLPEFDGTIYPVRPGGYTLASCVEEPPPLERPEKVLVQGQKFLDNNANGVWDDDEPAENGWIIEVVDDLGQVVVTTETADIDLDADGTIDPQSEGGVYQFHLDPGSYTIREASRPRFRQSQPAGRAGSEGYNVDLGEPQLGLDFGNVPLARIEGLKWNDLNANARRDPGEPPLEEVLICADGNENGRCEDFDLSEDVTARTAVDDPDTPEDETGQYVLEVDPGTHIIRERVPEGFGRTFPSSTVVYSNLFDHRNSAGPEWSRRDSDVTPATNDRFLGQFGNEVVHLNLEDLPPHHSIRVEFDLYAIRSWDGNQETDASGDRVGPDRWQIAASGPGVLKGTTFRNRPADTDGGTHGQAYPDDFGSGENPPRTGAAEINTLGFQYDGRTMDAVYRLSEIFSHTDDQLRLAFAAGGLEELANESWGIDNITVTAFGDSHRVTVGPGGVASDINFGNTNQTQTGVALVETPEPPQTTVALPRSEAQLDEWEPAWLTLYARPQEPIPQDASVQLKFTYDTNSVTASQVRFGQFFSEDQTPVIDDDTGKISLSATAPNGLPDQQYVLFAQVRLDPDQLSVGDTHSLKLQLEESQFAFGNRSIQPRIDVSTADGVVHFPPSQGVLHVPSPPLQPNLLDTNDDDTITRDDFAGLATCFGQTIDDSPGCRTYDVDRSGLVDVGDIALMAAALGSSRTQNSAPVSKITVPQEAALHSTESRSTSAAGQQHGSLDAPAAEGNGGTVSGTKWNDINGDGLWQQESEPPIPGVVIYADLNRNGELDEDEPSAITQQDDPATPEIDETGRYELTGLPSGEFVLINEEAQPLLKPTYPLPQAIATSYDGRLLRVDRNGNVFDPQPSGDDAVSPQQWIGLSHSPSDGKIYGIAPAPGQEPGSAVYRIDPLTGETSHVISLHTGPEQQSMPLTLSEGDLDFDPATGQLYAMHVSFQGQQDPQFALFRIDIGSGQAQFVGAFGQMEDPSAMAFSPDGRLLVLDSGRGKLVEIDKTNAQPVNTITLSQDNLGRYAGMDFDPNAGQLLLVTGGQQSESGEPPRVYRVERDEPNGAFTGALQILGNHERDLSGLEFVSQLGHLVAVVPGQPVQNVNFGNQELFFVPDGSDTVFAAGESDLVYGDNLLDDPRVISEGKADRLFGQGGSDQLFGQDKADVLWGADDTGNVPDTPQDDDQLDGGPGEDEVRQLIDNDQILQDDRLIGQGTDRLTSIESARLIGGSSANRLDASAFTLGSVTLLGDAGNDTLLGGQQDDWLEGGLGSDTLVGNTGDDVYAFADPEAGASEEVDEVIESDAVDGGVDQLHFGELSTSHDVTVDLTVADPVADHRGRRVVTPDPSLLEEVVGGHGSDTIAGNLEDNLLDGGPGGDELFGTGGNNTLIGGGGDDEMAGGVADDVFLFQPPDGTPQSDTVVGTSGGGDGFNTLDFSPLPADSPVTVDLSGSTVAQHAGRTVTSTRPRSLHHVVGTPGDDQISGNQNNNRLSGGPGGDVYILRETDAEDQVVEMPDGGVDTLDFSHFASGLSVDLNTSRDSGPIAKFSGSGDVRVRGRGIHLETVIGGRGSDEITGNGSDNRLSGRQGADTLRGAGGDDALVGGLGEDVLIGGENDDVYLFAGVSGPAERDELVEDDGPRGGRDTLDFSGLPDDESLVVRLDAPASAAHTGRLIELRNPGRIEDVLGSPGDDLLVGNQRDNHLSGLDGNDTLRGGKGDDILAGGLGDDVYGFLSPTAPEHDVVDEQDGGTDTLDFGGVSSPVFVDLSASTEVAEHEDPSDPAKRRRVSLAAGTTGIEIENVVGGENSDELRGNDKANRLAGGPGDDTLVGGKGNDWLIGGTGDNRLRGQAHDDIYTFTEGVSANDVLIERSATVFAGIASPGGSDTLDFSELEHPITLDLASVVPGTPDPVTVTPDLAIDLRLNDDDLTDDSQRSAEQFENIIGSQTDTNRLTGNDGNNALLGGAAPDQLHGGDGRDILVGGGELDQLHGAGRGDILIGGLVEMDGDPSEFQSRATTSALVPVMREWSLEGRPLAVRMANITAGIGSIANARLVAGETVLDDTQEDAITAGEGADWVFPPDTAVDASAATMRSSASIADSPVRTENPPAVSEDSGESDGRSGTAQTPLATPSASSQVRAQTKPDETLVHVQLVPVKKPSAASDGAVPSALSQVDRGEGFFIEVWLQTPKDSGVSGGFVDITLDAGKAELLAAQVDFEEVTDGDLDQQSGLVDDLGGATFDVGFGTAPDWTRLGFVELEALDDGPLEIGVVPGKLPMAIAGQGNVEWSAVRLEGAELAVDSVNRRPVVVVPERQTGDANTRFGIPGVRVHDRDLSGTEVIEVSLSAENGRIFLPTAEVKVLSGASGSASVTVQGAQTAINKALGSLTYRSHANFRGKDQITVTANDRGHEGSGGALQDTAHVEVEVRSRIHPFQHPRNRYDVNDDSRVTPFDAVAQVNFLNEFGAIALPVPPASPDTPPAYVDVSGDNFVVPLDVLLVINFLNALPGVAASEKDDTPPAEGEAAVERLVPLELAEDGTNFFADRLLEQLAKNQLPPGEKPHAEPRGATPPIGANQPISSRSTQSTEGHAAPIDEPLDPLLGSDDPLESVLEQIADAVSWRWRRANGPWAH